MVSRQVMSVPWHGSNHGTATQEIFSLSGISCWSPAGSGMHPAPSTDLLNVGKSLDLCSEHSSNFCTKIRAFPSIGEACRGGCGPTRPWRRPVQHTRREKPLSSSIASITVAPLGPLLQNCSSAAALVLDSWIGLGPLTDCKHNVKLRSSLAYSSLNLKRWFCFPSTQESDSQSCKFTPVAAAAFWVRGKLLPVVYQWLVQWFPNFLNWHLPWPSALLAVAPY